jgi:hypothetical protein
MNCIQVITPYQINLINARSSSIWSLGSGSFDFGFRIWDFGFHGSSSTPDQIMHHDFAFFRLRGRLEQNLNTNVKTRYTIGETQFFRDSKYSHAATRNSQPATRNPCPASRNAQHNISAFRIPTSAFNEA